MQQLELLYTAGNQFGKIFGGIYSAAYLQIICNVMTSHAILGYLFVLVRLNTTDWLPKQQKFVIHSSGDWKV